MSVSDARDRVVDGLEFVGAVALTAILIVIGLVVPSAWESARRVWREE